MRQKLTSLPGVLADSIKAKLGVCPRCMRLSLLLTGGGWLVVLAVGGAFPVAIALLLTGLTVAHLAAFAVRSSAGKAVFSSGGCGACGSRRTFIRQAAGLIPLVLLGRSLASPGPAQAQLLCSNRTPPFCLGGACPLFDAAGNPVAGATCREVNRFHCGCRFEREDPNCKRHSSGCRAQPPCPPLFRTAEDARHARNPIRGHCVDIGGFCGCRYDF
jgi:hypothetical protein